MSHGDDGPDMFEDFSPGDRVRCIRDFQDEDRRTGARSLIPKGTLDIVHSISSDHHGGNQLNLCKHGRGWSIRIWEKDK